MSEILEVKKLIRDDSIRRLLGNLRDISDHVVRREHKMSDEDLKLWDAVTRHSAVKSRLQQKETKQ